MRIPKSIFRVAIILSLILVIGACAIFARRIIRYRTWAFRMAECQAALESMKKRPPKHVTRQAWQKVVNDLHAAIQNACFAPEYASDESFKAFQQELEARLSHTDELDLEFARSVLLRMGEISPLAKRHIRKVIYLFDEDWGYTALEAWKQDCEQLSQDAAIEEVRRGPNYRMLTQLQGYTSPDDIFAKISRCVCEPESQDSPRFPWHLYFEEVVGEESVRHIAPEDWPARKRAWCDYFANSGSPEDSLPELLAPSR